METLYDINIGEEIKKRFDSSGMTQKEFGSRIGMPQQNVARVFNNEGIDTKRLLAVCRALGFNFFGLFFEQKGINITGYHNQLNEEGAHGNINSASDAVLAERVRSLEMLVAEKDERIKELKERIKELKK